MWPFTSKPAAAVLRPTVILGGITATYDNRWKRWRFAIREIDFELRGETLDARVIELATGVPRWISDNEAQINREIERHLKGWVEWDGKKHASGGIDVTELLSKQQIDVEYAGDSWGDLGITIVLREGKVVDSYAGD
jgi:hypothetical protein